MEFEYEYRITYANGQACEKNNELSIQISKEEYKKIIQGVLQNIPIEKIEGISETIANMTEHVQYVDRWKNRDGSMRKTALKKPRSILKVEFFLTRSEYLRLKQMKDPIETLERPEEHMTIYRNDGSSVKICSENGKVKIYDSIDRTTCRIVDAERFLSNIIW